MTNRTTTFALSLSLLAVAPLAHAERYRTEVVTHGSQSASVGTSKPSAWRLMVHGEGTHQVLLGKDNKPMGAQYRKISFDAQGRLVGKVHPGLHMVLDPNTGAATHSVRTGGFPWERTEHVQPVPAR